MTYICSLDRAMLPETDVGIRQKNETESSFYNSPKVAGVAISTGMAIK